MCRETVHPPHYVEHEKGVENGTTRLVVDTTSLMNRVGEATIAGLAIGDAKSGSGMGPLLANRCL